MQNVNVSLVPRHGAGILRGRGCRPGAERGVCRHQGRPGGAAGPGLGLHGCCPEPHRWGRLAADRFPDSRQEAFFRRHLFPQENPAGEARSAGNPEDIPGEVAGGASDLRSGRLQPGWPTAILLPAVAAGRSRAGVAGSGLQTVGEELRHQVWWIWRSAQVSLAPPVAVPDAPLEAHRFSKCAADGGDHPAGDVLWRHL